MNKNVWFFLGAVTGVSMVPVQKIFEESGYLVQATVGVVFYILMAQGISTLDSYFATRETKDE